MRKSAVGAASLGWGWTWGATILGTVTCIAVVGWLGAIAGHAGNPLLPGLLAAAVIFVLANAVRMAAARRRKQVVDASLDPLTGLLHGRAFASATERYLASLREPGSGGRGALLVADIDNLKALNDDFDYEVGDEAIQTIARALRGSVRSTDLVGRIGGEEFAILLIGADRIQSQKMADRLRRAVDRVSADALPRHLTLTIGVVPFQEGATLPDLMIAADRALYAAKQDASISISVSPAEPRRVRVAA